MFILSDESNEIVAVGFFNFFLSLSYFLLKLKGHF